jgi:hypothetical protein
VLLPQGSAESVDAAVAGRGVEAQVIHLFPHEPPGADFTKLLPAENFSDNVSSSSFGTHFLLSQHIRVNLYYVHM